MLSIEFNKILIQKTKSPPEHIVLEHTLQQQLAESTKSTKGLDYYLSTHLDCSNQIRILYANTFISYFKSSNKLTHYYFFCFPTVAFSL